MTARARLAAQQAELLRAVLTGDPPPPGFDGDRMRVQTAALIAKRRRVVARLRPDLPAGLGDDFAAAFDRYAREHPREFGTSMHQDADRFATWVRRSRWRRLDELWMRLRGLARPARRTATLGATASRDA